jgi:outer membrane biosynthesis protein TonB
MFKTSQAECRRRKRLYLKVAGFHVAAILIVALVYHLPRRKRTPKPPPLNTMPVKLASFPAPTPPAPPPARPTPPRPERVVQPPPPPTPPPPKPVVKPPPKKVTPPKPTPPKPAPKKVTPPKPKPKPKVAPKPTPKPTPKPKPRLRTPEEIRRSIQQQQVRPQVQPRPKPQPVVPKVDVNARLERLRQQAALDAANSAASTSSAADLRQSYYADVHRQIYRIWLQPSINEVSPSASPVIVRLTVAASGVVSGRIVQTESDNPNLTRSVRDMLQNLQRLPAPPSELGPSVSFNVSLRISG